MDKKDLEPVQNLLILPLLKQGTDYDLLSELTGINVKTLYARFPKKKVFGSSD